MCGAALRALQTAQVLGVGGECAGAEKERGQPLHAHSGVQCTVGVVHECQKDGPQPSSTCGLKRRLPWSTCGEWGQVWLVVHKVVVAGCKDVH